MKLYQCETTAEVTCQTCLTGDIATQTATNPYAPYYRESSSGHIWRRLSTAEVWRWADFLRTVGIAGEAITDLCDTCRHRGSDRENNPATVAVVNP